MSGIGQKNIGWLTIFIRKIPVKRSLGQPKVADAERRQTQLSERLDGAEEMSKKCCPGVSWYNWCLFMFGEVFGASRWFQMHLQVNCFQMFLNGIRFQLPFFWKEFGLSPFSVQISKITRPYIESCREREGELRKKLAEEQVRIQDDPRLSKLSQLNIRCVYIQWYTYIYILLYTYIYIYAILSYNSTKESESDSLQECTSRALWPPGPPRPLRNVHEWPRRATRRWRKVTRSMDTAVSIYKSRWKSKLTMAIL